MRQVEEQEDLVAQENNLKNKILFIFMIKYFQLGFIIFLVLLNIISTFLFSNRISDYIFKSLISCSVHSPILNIKIKVNGDKSILNNLGNIIISNHQNATDLIIVNYLFDKINCVCKSNIVCDDDVPIYFRFIKIIEKFIIPIQNNSSALLNIINNFTFSFCYTFNIIEIFYMSL